MKRLIIAQIGHVDATSELSHLGKVKMTDLAQSLRKMDCGPTIRILSSPAIPAYQSAQILAEFLECHDVSIVDCLYTDWNHPPKTNAAIEAILRAAETADTLVIVTHREHVHDIQHRIYKKIFGRAFPERALSPATALIISPETRSVTIVS